MLLIAAAVLAVLLVVLLLNIKRLRRLIAKLLHGQGYNDSSAQHSLANLRLPVLVLSGKSIVWYNEAFANGVLPGSGTLPAERLQGHPGF